MKFCLRDLLWTVCLGWWSFLFQIMHTQRYLPSSPTVSLQSLSHLTQNMHVSFGCQVSYVSKTNSSAQPTHSNQHISKKSHLYSVLCPLVGMGEKKLTHTHKCFYNLSNFRNKKVTQTLAWKYTVCPGGEQLLFSGWIKDHEHLCLLPWWLGPKTFGLPEGFCLCLYVLTYLGI